LEQSSSVKHLCGLELREGVFLPILYIDWPVKQSKEDVDILVDAVFLRIDLQVSPLPPLQVMPLVFQSICVSIELKGKYDFIRIILNELIGDVVVYELDLVKW
jgi:hypothetical protein